MTEVPVETPVTIPPASIVATPVVPLLHVPPGVRSLKVVVEPAQTMVAPVIASGTGLTVTVIANGEPAQEPVVDVGVTRYSTVPATVLLELVNIWLIVTPEPALSPAMLPVIVPVVQVKLLGTLDVNAIFVPVPLHMVAVAEFVTEGMGLTVTVALPVIEFEQVGESW
jgi:hypothetical protein